MESRKEFFSNLQGKLKAIDPAILLYNENEFWLIQQPYEYIEYYAVEQRLYNTAIALSLARGLHNGTYRKFGVVKDGETHRLPYFIHCLLVCRMLLDIHVPLSNDEKDILLAAALCHDLIEDIPFKKGGKELYEDYQLDKRVYETVCLVSKKKEATIEEEKAYFRHICENKLALLVKLADRGNNVEDLYNMSAKKFEEYVWETQEYFLPMCDYGQTHYEELYGSIHILRDKINTLINASSVMIEQFEGRNQALRNERDQLKLENINLRKRWKELWEEGVADE